MNERELFIAAMQIDAGPDRDAFLDRACRDDARLRQRIENLLLALNQADSFLQRPALADDANADHCFLASDPAAPQDSPGDMFGPYKLIERIGEGGMGTVWLAEQTSPVRRQVALKVIKPGMDSRHIIARFNAERQALSLMDHPNIAKMLDAGSSQDQRPYFVMALVRGVPITEHCDKHRLTLRQRLELFHSVCSAIQHAHQRGVIHRDIKPSNVLVEEHEGRPVARVIDFGVAKALGQSLVEMTMVTGLGQLVGTLEYMSPEQASVSGVDIDTRTDVYSLGVLLYELLTGGAPLDREWVRTTAFDQTLRTIREQDAPRPSRKLSGSGSISSVAMNRATEPARLIATLRGELDWIAMKALEKDRDRRYESAGAFAQDIQRHLDGEIVQACPPSAGYRLGKYLRKNKVAAAAAALVSLSLVGGVAAATIGMVHAQGARRIAEQATKAERHAREEESRQLRITEAVTDFVLYDLLALTSVEGQHRFSDGMQQGLSKDSTLKELIDRAAESLDAGTDMAPEVEMQLRWMMGVNYRGMGEFRSAIPHLERSLDLSIASRGENDETTLNTANSLAYAYIAAGQFNEAVELCDRTLELASAHLGDSHSLTLRLLNTLAVGHRQAGRIDMAIPLYERAVEGLDETLGPDSADALISRNNLARCYLADGDADRSLPLLESTLERMTRVLGRDHPSTLVCMLHLTEARRLTGRIDEALVVAEEALERSVTTLGSDHPNTLLCMSSLALVYRDAGELSRAIELAESALERMADVSGADHPNTLQVMSNLAVDYFNARRLEEATDLSERAFRGRRAVLGVDHPDTLRSVRQLARYRLASGAHEEAVRLLEEALRLQQESLGREQPRTLELMVELGAACWSAGRLDRAIELLEEILPHAHRLASPQSAPMQLAEYYLATGRVREFEALVTREIEAARSMAPANPAMLAGLLASAGHGWIGLGAYETAEPLLRECLAIRREHLPDDWLTFNTRSMLGGTLLARARALKQTGPAAGGSFIHDLLNEARPLLITGYEGMQQRIDSIPPPGRPRLGEALDRLIELSTLLGKEDEAEEWRRERGRLLLH